MSESPRVGVELERWLDGPGPKTVGSLVEVFGEKSFAVLFVVLLAPTALPLPTGGATHVLEVIAMVLAAQLVAGRRDIWIPRRWRSRELVGPGQQRFVRALMRVVRWVEQHSRPRLTFLFTHRLSGVAFGALAFGGVLAAFLAPPFTGLDTLPALGVVVLSLGVLSEDAVGVIAGVVIGAIGIIVEIALGRALFEGLRDLL